jgi:hypothetical protein
VTRILLDSTCAIDLLRGRPGALARLDETQMRGDEWITCAVVAAEVSAGLRPKERDAAHRLFEGLEVAPMGAGEGRLAGWWMATYRRRGRTLALADCLIAAAAIGAGATLATGNPKDFPMTGLQVEHWPAGG